MQHHSGLIIVGKTFVFLHACLKGDTAGHLIFLIEINAVHSINELTLFEKGHFTQYLNEDKTVKCHNIHR